MDSVFLPPFLEQTLLDVLSVETGFFSAMIDLITRAGVESILTDMEKEYTLLAPINQAFLALDSETTSALKNDTDLLEQVLSYHVIVGIYPSARLENQTKLETLAGMSISVTVTEEGGYVLDERTEIIGADSGVAGSGLIHVVGSVLLPSPLRVPLISPSTTSPSPIPMVPRPNPPTKISSPSNPSVLLPISSNRTQSPNPMVRATDAPVQGQPSLPPGVTSYASYFSCGYLHLLVVLIVILGQ